MSLVSSVYWALSQTGEFNKVSTTIAFDEPVLQRLRSMSNLTDYSQAAIVNQVMKEFFRQEDEIRFGEPHIQDSTIFGEDKEPLPKPTRREGAPIEVVICDTPSDDKNGYRIDDDGGQVDW